MSKLNIVSVVGARPQFVKVAAVERAFAQLRSARSDAPATTIVHTGQHYDDNMSRVFFDELAIPPPAVNLAIGSGPQGQQTGAMLTAIESFLTESKPSAVVVYGDTNSTLAAALAAVKLQIPVAHVEAGLRSFNRVMPEEINRVLTDHAADLLLAPTKAALTNLEREGLAGRTRYTGDVMYDAVLHHAELAKRDSQVLERFKLRERSYALATIHRAENTHPQNLRVLLDRLNEVAAQHFPVLFPVHPRTRAVIASALAGWRPHADLQIIEPLGYVDLLRAVQGARFIVTDSGGLQKEAAFLGCQCFTIRDQTEWTETVELGVNVLVGSGGERLHEALAAHLSSQRTHDHREEIDAMYGAGRAGMTVAEAVTVLASAAVS